MNLVGMGGGTGLPVLLQGMKQLSLEFPRGTTANSLNVSAIVSVSDNGGSSGQLRQSFGIPAVGDLRNCLVALSEGDKVLADLFQHRFQDGNGLNGHSLGNLIVTALIQKSGTLCQAVEMAKEVLNSKGCVLPVTESAAALCAEMESGETIRGELQITAARKRIKRVWLEPERPAPSGGVLRTLSCADAIVVGPGSLYTSIIPNLLVEGVARAVRNSRALKIFVCNLMTQPGESDGFTAADHLRVVESYLGCGAIDICVLNSQEVKQTAEQTYRHSDSEPVLWDEEEINQMGITPVVADLLSEDQAKVKHSPAKLARLIHSLIRGSQRARDILSGQESLIA